MARTPQRTAVVVNAHRVTGTDELREQITSALADAGWPAPAWLETTAEDPGTGQARQAARDGAEVVMVCGGDGTVRAVIEGLVGTDAALAVLPGGTGNLLAKNLGIPTDVDGGVRAVTAGERRRIDVGEVDGQAFAIMAGIGFDAKIMDDAPARVKNVMGPVAYVFSALRHLVDREMHVEITVDGGETLRRHARTVVVGNVGRLQGGVDLLPDARPDSGELDVAVVAPRNIGHWLKLVVAIALRRRHAPHRETFRGSHVLVRAGAPEPRQLDGDVIDDSTTLEVSVRRSALTVCVAAADERADDIADVDARPGGVRDAAS
ncbi:diacylglycerol kinase family protein [Cellulomonas sp. HZM]|uniref:diacylglycerol/lipid kinase family protein n=1 Tax=Cellulomonas sp. HZM TaxID=1454010 RepID=UPI000493431E|nr:YegS/Rv2252/BmrU family lipid kinase [Cellulomonas sp. HZM]